MNGMPISTRREFFVRGLGLVGVSVALPNFLVRTALAGSKAGTDESILVVLQMGGGNDGLSTVVPYGHEEYNRARTASRIDESDVITLNDEVGLHPKLSGFKDLYDNGALAVVQGVGYPNPNQSHFTSMDIWQLGDPTARSNNTQRESAYGWLGRYCDIAFKDNLDPKLALAIGNARAPRAIRGREHAGLSFQAPASFGFYGDRGDRTRAAAYRTIAQLSPANPDCENSNLDFVTQTAGEANSSSEEIRRVASNYKSPIDYPRNNSLSSSLNAVAALIAGGLSTRVYYVFQDGFDTHAGQRSRHDRLMTDLDAAVGAFQKDLERQGNAKRVITMTFSEFGRRVHENGSQGTDHGMAGPMFLIGPGVKPGVHGDHPSLAKDDLVLGRDLKFGIDFRSVYAAVLEKWLGTPSTPVLGEEFCPLDCVA